MITEPVTIEETLRELYKKGISFSVRDDKLKVKASKEVLTDEILAHIKENKEEIKRYFLDMQDSDSTVPLLSPLNDDSENMESPLSFAQQRLWFIDRLYGGSAHYNIPAALSVEGSFDVASAEKAIIRIIERHEPLRTVFSEHDGESVQVVKDEFNFSLDYHDLSDLDTASQELKVEELIHSDSTRVFDLTADLMVRAAYIHLEKGSASKGVLQFTVHHIASDGWSMGILANEFVQQYQAAAAGEGDPLTALPIKYTTFSQWQRKWLGSDALDRELRYWKDTLNGIPVVHNIPLEFSRPQHKEHDGGNVLVDVNKAVYENLKLVAKKHEVSMFMLLHSVLGILLARHSNRSDIVIGTPVANRTDTQLESMIGFFVNTLVLRLNTEYEHFSDYLSHVKQVNIGAQANQNVPFEYLVDQCQVVRSVSYSPIFQIMFSMDTTEQSELRIPGLNFHAMSGGEPVAKFDLDISAEEHEDGINISWIYDKSIFSEKRIKILSEHFVRLLNSVSLGNCTSIDSLAMLSNSEQKNLLDDLNTPHSVPSSDLLIHELVEEQAQRQSDNTALIFEDSSLSYEELNVSANRLAHYLRDLGVGEETLVGICMERSLEMVVAILAVLKAGGAYVPIDPRYPRARIEHVFDDTKLQHLLVNTASLTVSSENNTSSFVSSRPITIINLDDELDSEKVRTYSASNPERLTGHNSSFLAYVIYTSGSTGTPKGVLQTHENVSGLFSTLGPDFSFNESDTWCLFHSIAFDFSVWEIWGALFHGASLTIPSHDCTRDSMKFVRFCETHKISVLNQTPSAFKNFSEIALKEKPNISKLRFVIFGGEALHISNLIPWWDHYGDEKPQIVNMYGITETTVHASIKYLSRKDIGHSNIGKRLQDQKFYLLDQHLNLVPEGAEGELYIGGGRLARGYLNNPSLTQERFIENPFSDIDNDRLYKTGDLLRYIGAGNLEYIDRVDDQVKIRGFRIELGEIQHQVEECELISSSCVIARQDDNGEKALVAYIILQNHGHLGDQEIVRTLNQQLKLHLPEYMVPSIFVRVDAWPLTQNGKIDRNALQSLGTSLQYDTYNPPESDTEKSLVAIWANLLKLDESAIGKTSRFFELGGHSILVIRLASEIEKQFSYRLSMKAFFEKPVIESLAKLIDSSQSSDEHVIKKIDRNSDIPLSFAQQRIWFVDQLQGGTPEYNIVTPVKIIGSLDVEALHQALKLIVDRHEILRTTYLSGEQGAQQYILENVNLALARDEERYSTDAIAEFISAENRTPFDLSKDLMLRCRLLNTDVADESVLVLTVHHIAFDEWSFNILIEELSDLYRSLTSGEASQLAPLPIQYSDFSVWQRESLSEERLTTLLDFWLDSLSGIPELHQLPLDKPRPIKQQFSAGRYSHTIDEDLLGSLNRFSKNRNVTLFTVLQTALSIVLARWSNTDDVVMGTPVAGRQSNQVERLIGFFINSVVLRTRVDESQSFSEFVLENGQNIIDSFEHQDLPFEVLVDKIEPTRDLSYTPIYQISFSYHNIDIVDIDVNDIKFEGVAEELALVKYDIEIHASLENGLAEISWIYADSLFDEGTIKDISDSFDTFLRSAVSSPDKKISELEYLNKHYSEQLSLASFAQPNSIEPVGVHSLFEEQVRIGGERKAVDCDGEHLSYEQTNCQANQLARYLISQGVVPGSVVAVISECSVDLVVGVLAVLKAGAGYLPIDIENSKTRVRNMLDDDGISFVLMDIDHLSDIDVGERKVIPLNADLRSRLVHDQDPSNLTDVCDDYSTNLAYIIYSSGSTGVPKGIEVTHGALLASLTSRMEYYKEPMDGLLSLVSVSFDASLIGLFWPLAKGACLYMLDSYSAREPRSVIENIEENGISHLVTTAQVYKNLLDYAEDAASPAPLKVVISGGDALDCSTLKQHQRASWSANADLYNEYGPTEATIWSSVYRCGPDTPKVIPIGQSPGHCSLHILSDSLCPLPFGVDGELYIGGSGLALGYRNQPELTAEKFITHPSYGRLYRTGDIVKRLKDGDISFIGRRDGQVKLRGFRIELGEIENQLIACSSVKFALVKINESAATKFIAAYIVPNGESEHELDERELVDTLAAELSQKLPEYMLPSSYKFLDKFPLGVNGKIDIAKLPEIEFTSRETYIEATSDTENKLVSLLQDLLLRERIGVNDDFFEIGGDSILSIQFVARAKKLGINITTKQLFKCKTIRKLSKVVGTEIIETPDQGIIEGEIVLSPIQRLFLTEKTGDLSHFNQSVLLVVPRDLTFKNISEMVSRLYLKHDALRLGFNQIEDNWVGTHLPLNERFVEETCVKEIIDTEVFSKEIEERCLFWQQQFDLSNGPLFKAILFTSSDGDSCRLFLVAHHLVVDAVSWRIILSDLENEYKREVLGSDAAENTKTESLQSWNQMLKNRAESGALDQEYDYWHSVDSQRCTELPLDRFDLGESTYSTTVSIAAELSSDKTIELLQDCNLAYRTNISELILSALYFALKKWAGGDEFRIQMESHGRDLEFTEKDVTETVGWFTSLYPVALNISSRDIADIIFHVKDQYRAVPNNGIGYGLIKYFSDEGLNGNGSNIAQVEFNYLGQLDQAISEDLVFELAPESSGNSISDGINRHALVGLTGMVADGKLSLNFDYSEKIFDKKSIEKLLELTLEGVDLVIDHCKKVKRPVLTLSDFPIAQVSKTQLQDLQEKYADIDRLYPATPMQSGMVFQSLFDQSAYITQTFPSLRGHLDVSLFKQAWQSVIDAYDVYRTCFVGMETKLHQLVLKDAELPWEYHDWCHLSEEEREKGFHKYLLEDKEKGFDLSIAPLIRISLFRMSADLYTVLWTHHHALTDGWCLPIIYGDVVSAYEDLTKGEQPTFKVKGDYQNYINWLQQQNHHTATEFWRKNLQNIEAPTVVANRKLDIDADLVSEYREINLTLEKDKTQAIKDSAKSLGVTVNTLVQYAWAYLLHRYSGDSRVVFGATISGRPAEVEDIEDMVGLFINSIPVVVDFGLSIPCIDQIKNLHEDFQISCDHGYLSLVDIKKQSKIINEQLFESLLVFENYPVGELMTSAASSDDVLIETFENNEQTEYAITIIASCSESLDVKMGYQSARFDDDVMLRISDHLFQIIQTLPQTISQGSAGKHPQINSAREQAAIAEFNATSLPYTDDLCIHELIQTQAEKTPNAIACVFDGQQYSYQELLNATRSLASQLHSLGAKKNTLIAVNVEKSFEQLVALVAVMMSGAAYLPLNTQWPYAHKRKVIANGKCKIVLGNDYQTQQLASELKITCQATSCDDDLTFQGCATLSPSDLAYVIFTSGSTGEPKGVMISHNSAINTMEHINKRFQLSEQDCVFAISSIAFDLSVYDYFGPLMIGGTVCLPTESEVVDPSMWCELIERHAVTLWDSVPQLAQLLIEQAENDRDARDLSSLSVVMMSGDWIPTTLPQRIQTLIPNASINSLGGATEGSIWSIIYPIEQMSDSWRSIPYGRPLPNQQFHILDSQLNESPYGTKGELFIGGIGVANGYWNNVELSNQRFISHPQTGDRIYRTGDTGRFLADGNIEFLGRIDDQVKIRGYRVELSEIEYQLLSYSEVVDAVVVIQDISEEKHIVAYIHAMKNSAVEDSFVALLKERLAANLPSYMMPSAFVVLDTFPLTANGKVDKNLLPEPTLESRNEYQAPRNELEGRILEIWQSVMRNENLGIFDNFFEVGGDSILSIQITARAAREGLYFTTREFFEAQTVDKLAQVCRLEKKRVISQEASSGTTILLPFQSYFLANHGDCLNHFNQSVLLDVPSSLGHGELKSIVESLYVRHDALRLGFSQVSSEWVATYSPMSAEIVDKSSISESIDTWGQTLESRCDYWQRQFDIAEGPLFRAVLFTQNGSDKAKLLLLAHHLVVDGVSWRILLSDIELAYTQLIEDQTIMLPSKTVSVKDWATTLSEAAQADAFESEANYWRDMELKQVVPLDTDMESAAYGLASSSEQIFCNIDEEVTRYLLEVAPKAYKAKINELLLASLVFALKQWQCRDSYRFSMEGHGRSDAFGDLDLSGTIGWLTSYFPVVLDCKHDNLGDILRSVKEAIREIPNDGVGYGVFSHMRERDSEDTLCDAKDLFDFGFNYLGQLDKAITEESTIEISSEDAGSPIDSNAQRMYKLEINSFAQDGKLTFALGYSSDCYHKETIENLVKLVESSIVKLYTDREENAHRSVSVSDFPLADANAREIVEWKVNDQIDDLYPATGMQEGLLFHSLVRAGSYVTQTLMRIDNLSIENFRSAWDSVIERHCILRTSFVGLDVNNTHQLVHKNVSFPWESIDLSALDSDEQVAKIESIRKVDKEVGFDFLKPPLMRMTQIDLGGGTQQLIWSYHHALLDGWCIPLVFGEVTEFYRALQTGEAPLLTPVRSYRNYAVWLQQQDRAVAERFWASEVGHVEGPTPLPLASFDNTNEEVGVYEHTVVLDENETEALVSSARKMHTTVNVVLQAAWSLLLSRYSGEQNVVFGTTTSGRPPGLSGVEQIIGLFINTVPAVIDVDFDSTVSDWLGSLHSKLVERETHNYFPLGDIQRLSTVNHGLFDSILMFENFPVDHTIGNQVTSAGLDVEDIQSIEGTDYAIGITAHLSNTLFLQLEFQKALFSDASSEQVSNHLMKIVQELSAEPERKLVDVPMLSSADEHDLLKTFNDTRREDLIEEAWPALFEKQAELTPHAIAARYADKSISYELLERRSRQLASALNERNIGSGSTVAVLAERDIELLVYIVAVLRAGAAYIPLDPDYPIERLQVILGESEPATLLASRACAGLFDDVGGIWDSRRIITEEQLLSAHKESSRTLKKPSLNDLAYIIFTSGSTGKPKGVMVDHLGMVNNMLAKVVEALELNDRDIIAQTASQCFDISVWQFLTALGMGATTDIVPTDITRDPDALQQYLIEHEISIWEPVPSMMHAVLAEPQQFSTLRCVIPTGEALTVDLVDRWFEVYPKIPLFNAYGPTECSDDVTMEKIHCQVDRVWLGKPVPNAHVHIVDARQKLLPIGAVGEIAISGPVVGLGYINQPKLTNEVFIDNQYHQYELDKRMYLTGDLGRRGRNGKIEFVGRKDHQIKMRGLRIELGEIETCLAACDGIEQAVVVASELTQHNIQMIGFVVLEDENSFDPEVVKESLEKQLPRYMVPHKIVPLEKFPLSLNGKIDRKALPVFETNSLTDDYKAPENETEKIMVDIWAKLLKLEAEHLSTTANFFESGGHSLLVVRLVSEIRSRFNVEIPIIDVFELSTVNLLATLIERQVTLEFIKAEEEKASIKSEGVL